jgi:hypothetical protein
LESLELLRKKVGLFTPLKTVHAEPTTTEFVFLKDFTTKTETTLIFDFFISRFSGVFGTFDILLLLFRK